MSAIFTLRDLSTRSLRIPLRTTATAILRKEFHHALTRIDVRIVEDRSILNEVQCQVDRAESNRGADSQHIKSLRDYLLAVEGQFTSARDAGTAAARTLHDEILILQRAPPAEVS